MTNTRLGGLVLLLPLLILVRSTPASAAQIAPNVIFINANERGAEVVVRNPGETPIEITVRLLFGYEVSEENGKVSTIYPEDDAPHERSAHGWLRAYPQRAALAPGHRQTIRLFRRAPEGLPPGEYWARLSVESRPVTIPTTEVGDDIQVRVGVTTRQRVPIFVRIGEANASVRVSEVRSALEAHDGKSTVIARWRGEVEGNASFLGTVVARIEKDGEVVAEASGPLGLFVPGWRRLRVPLPAGTTRESLSGARLILEVAREHPAVQDRYLLPGEGDRWEGPLELD